ncbi:MULTISPECIES: PRTRC system protein C [Bacteroidaceae]|jgi:PRTRC genetic system protein C|uniref:PRTRC system protein C n=1 Tax=Bacteroidaceae TaxID=815 RepID=UPI0025942328|nr:PRTRC system protein C [Phocaeicola coprocola]
MALQVTGLVRTFKFNDKVLADPNPEMTPDEVLLFYSGTYPELTTSNVHQRLTEEGQLEYEFKTTIGTKG